MADVIRGLLKQDHRGQQKDIKMKVSNKMEAIALNPCLWDTSAEDDGIGLAQFVGTKTTRQGLPAFQRNNTNLRSCHGRPPSLRHHSQIRAPPRAPPEQPVALQRAADTGPAAPQGKAQTPACFPIWLDPESPSQL